MQRDKKSVPFFIWYNLLATGLSKKPHAIFHDLASWVNLRPIF